MCSPGVESSGARTGRPTVLAGTDLVDLRREARRGTKIRTSVHDDLVDRLFCAVAANEIWLTDITEHRTDESQLYLCAIKDVYRGSHVRSHQFVHKLSHNGLRDSVGRVGAATTPRWNPSSRSFNAMSSTDNVGPPGPNYGSRS
jgi:hypothetical protein